MVRRLRPRSGRVGEFVGEYPLGRDAGAAKRGRLCVEILAGGADSGVAEDWFHRPVGLTSCDATDLGQRVVRRSLLSDPTARFQDLGPDYHTSRVVTERKIRNHIAHLTAMGFHVTLQPAA